MDQAGNLRGTTQGVTGAGAFSLGTVFELSPDQDGKWKKTSLFQFSGGNSGTLPLDGVAIDSTGNLYGTTFEGGNGAGLIFELTPQKEGPAAGNRDLRISAMRRRDQTGKCPQAVLGLRGCGTVFELKPQK